MIQRIQTIYLLAAAVVAVVCLCLPVGTYGSGGLVVSKAYNLWIASPNGLRDFSVWPLFAVLAFVAAISLYAIFVYSNRIVQARFCMFGMLLLLGWYILFFVLSRFVTVGEGATEFTPSLTCALPVVSMVLIFLARRAILADEKLVRAADRIR